MDEPPRPCLLLNASLVLPLTVQKSLLLRRTNKSFAAPRPRSIIFPSSIFTLFFFYPPLRGTVPPFYSLFPEPSEPTTGKGPNAGLEVGNGSPYHCTQRSVFKKADELLWSLLSLATVAGGGKKVICRRRRGRRSLPTPMA
jgi:hypothetical protein